MFKKILFAFLTVAILGSIAASGYEFGQYLAKRNGASDPEATVQFTEKGLKLA